MNRSEALQNLLGRRDADVVLSKVDASLKQRDELQQFLFQGLDTPRHRPFHLLGRDARLIQCGRFDQIANSLGLRQVVVTGALDLSVIPLMKYLGIEDYVTNRLEFVNGVATGRLLPPVVAAATKASWIRTFAEREGLSLSDSYAYTDSMSDLPMLSVVGHPAAVNPDMRLRQTALHHDWPILNLK